MTVTRPDGVTTPGTPSNSEQAMIPEDYITVIIDGAEVHVPKGTLVIRAAENIGIEIPRFCDHPLLAPAGACRQCLVEVATPGPDGSMRAMPKPQASCTLEATDGMVVRTQETSPVAAKAQEGVLELLLINHPLDCPVCDKGGECPLQNQAMSHGRPTSRFVEVKRTFPKPIAISTQILLDRERCVLCQRCTRFSKQIAGDPFIDLQLRGNSQQIGTFDGDILDFAGGNTPCGQAQLDESGAPFASYFSGNTIQICPVGALTSAMYRFRARPFDLVSTQSIAHHDACGSEIRIDVRRGKVMRHLAGDDPAVNEEWITDKDRFAFRWAHGKDRLENPQLRERLEDGSLAPQRTANWVESMELAAAGLQWARDNGGVGVLPGGRLTMEDAYAYAKFARVALGTNDIDYRARWYSEEEESFLGQHVAGSAIGVTFNALEAAPTVLLAGLEAEEEAGVTFLRLRKAVQAGGTKVYSVAPFSSAGVERLDAQLLPAAPGTEATVLDGISGDLAESLSAPGAVILIGERLATSPGAITAAVALAERTGARLAWIPRRAGERGAIEAGALPGLLPGGRPVADNAARVDTGAVWGVADVPATPGRSVNEILQAVIDGELSGLVIGGVDVADLPDPDLARRAVAAAGFVVSLEVRSSEITDLADVVFPVAPPVEKAGTFINWEGRLRTFPTVLEGTARADYKILDQLAGQLGISLGTSEPEAIRRELAEFDTWDGNRLPARPGAPLPAADGAVLATWALMLDNGRGQDGEPYLRGTSRVPVVRINDAFAAKLGAVDGDILTVATGRGSITLPLAIAPDLVDDVVWIPANSGDSRVKEFLAAQPGESVTVERQAS